MKKKERKDESSSEDDEISPKSESDSDYDVKKVNTRKRDVKRG